MNALPKAILFDLDDTIVTEGDRDAVLLKVAEDLHDQILPNDPATLADRVGTALDAFWSTSPDAKAARLEGSTRAIHQARERVIGDVLGKLGVAHNVAHAFAGRFSDVRSQGLRLFDGAHDTIVILRNSGVRLALVANGAADLQRAKLERFSLTPLFDHIQIEGERGYGKPEEIAYLEAMQALGAASSDTWMVGDNLEHEVAVPQRLGLRDCRKFCAEAVCVIE
jgi:putative hydrolase of the HAD superfamily